MTREEHFYPSADGVHQIHAVLWLPQDKPRGVVQIVHGICEYALRYAPFAQYLTGQGFAVAGNDHLGHGLSVKEESERGYFEKWDHLVADVFALRRMLGERFQGLPYFLLGHSMGSFVARTYLIDHPGALTGCMLSGTGYQAPVTVALGKAITALGDPRKVNKPFLKVSMGSYNKAFTPNRTPVDWISRDEAVVDAYLADPLCAFQTKGGMNHAMMVGLGRIVDKRGLARMDVSTPVYLFSGDADPVGAMGKGVMKVYGLFQKAGCKDVRMKLYPGGRHEMLNETNKGEVWADCLAWLEEHMG